MLIQCPSCRTTYRIGDNVVAIPNPTFRCSRCKHIFILGLKSAPGSAHEVPSPPAASQQQDEDESRELTFSFAPRQNKLSWEEPDKDEFKFPEHEKPPTIENPDQQRLDPAKLQFQEPSFLAQDDLGSREPPSPTFPMVGNNHPSTAPNDGTEESWSITTSRPEEEPFDISPEVPTDSDKPSVQSPSPYGERETLVAENPHQEHPLSILPYLTLFCCLLLFYSVLTFVNQARPQTVETFLRAIPWLGDSVFKNNHLRLGVDLKSLRPGFQPIPGGREVFVISGVAVNHNPVSVRGIQLEGNIYNAQGKEIERQTIWVGNAISSKIIRGMTAQEISDIQKLPPLRRFEIAPEQPMAFAIIFFKPSGEIKYFSCRVLSSDQVT
jgi:predicted Zn finger-like uncharacterized protein